MNTINDFITTNKLGEILAERNITVDQLSEDTGIDKEVIQNEIDNPIGSGKLSVYDALIIADYLKLTLNDIWPFKKIHK